MAAAWQHFSTAATSADAADTGGPAKRMGVSQDSRIDTLQELVVHQGKLALKSAADARLLRSTLRILDVKAKTMLTDVLDEEGKRYRAATKGKKGHGEGPPSCCYLIRIILLMLPAASDADKTNAESDKAHIESFLAHAAPKSKNLKRGVLCFKIESPYDDSRKRIVFKMAPQFARMEDLIVDYIESLKDNSELHGVPKAGALEDKVQGLLEKVTGETRKSRFG